jgi:tripartite-type tricarboxylate transporter receptor subunit TctC
MNKIVGAIAACVVTAIALSGMALSGHAQTQYPSKPVRLLIPFPPGGPTDSAVRVFLPALAQALGQDFSVVNMAGSHGALAPTALLSAPPDGHTLLVGNSSPLVAVPILRKDAPYDPARDFAPVSLMGWTPLLLVVSSNVPAKNLAELIRYARDNPGKLTVAAANPPTIFTMAQLRTREKLDIASKEYPIDAAAMKALLDGEAQIMAAGVNTALEHIKEGRLRAVATLGANRARLAPDVPTMAEAGVPGFAILPWVAMFAPGKTPPAIVEHLSREVAAAMKRPDVRDRLERAAFESQSSTPAELGAFLKDQLNVWGTVAREAGLQGH